LSEMGEQSVQAGVRRRSALLAVMLVAGLPFWVLTVTNFIGNFGSGHVDPTAVDILAMIGLMAVPMLVGALAEAWIQRWRLRRSTVRMRW